MILFCYEQFKSFSSYSVKTWLYTEAQRKFDPEEYQEQSCLSVGTQDKTEIQGPGISQQQLEAYQNFQKTCQQSTNITDKSMRAVQVEILQGKKKGDRGFWGIATTMV